MDYHEEMFARNFIKTDKKERYLALLQSAKGRSKLAFGLNHCSDIDMRYASLVPTEYQSEAGIYELLKKKGASDKCHVMSSNPMIDGEDIPLIEALKSTIGRGMGTFISCIPGRLGYFEFEDPGKRYIRVVAMLGVNKLA